MTYAIKTKITSMNPSGEIVYLGLEIGETHTALPSEVEGIEVGDCFCITEHPEEKVVFVKAD